jgi:hypothetical protein
MRTVIVFVEGDRVSRCVIHYQELGHDVLRSWDD